mmetsp:Transcript_25143/g.44473  ORF Transcript_25143/g.44473 Transcript_25143/m.44473 type:complete len:183 (-) Transcript_25143:60-608(-)
MTSFMTAPPGSFQPPMGTLPPGSFGGSPMATMPPGSMPPMGAPPMGSMPPQTMSMSMPPMGGPPMGSMPPQTMSMSMGAPPPPYASMPPPGMGSMAMGAPPPMASMGPGGPPPMMSGQYMQNVSRPQMTGVANPPIVANNIQYGPSYKMQYQKRSTADKTAVKYTGFLPLEGVYEEDTCRIG